MKKPLSDSVLCGILLALSGGCMDAYSYLCRGHVFANAQTGNILLFGIHLANGNGAEAVKYFWPISAFILGIILADILGEKTNTTTLHWRQISVVIEALILIIVAFLPNTLHSVANALISFACGMQVESFRKIYGNNIATTMCIGNMRSGTHHIVRYISTREKSHLNKALLYFGIILSFVVGAVLESGLILAVGNYAILLSSVWLILTFFILFRSLASDESNHPR